ncbi:hypothetical protein GCM10009847_09670 [Leucobacter tardus]|uniref:histidine kinase n=1 Tax=Leucobacter tardus TaxID=501483 RepID=A0A939QBH3_9MICO|nr:ATP-binding protein [Leucobacter tardus]MBO2989165.1 GHKL domain-containing protein [Leucobacter tardus]
MSRINSRSTATKVFIALGLTAIVLAAAVAVFLVLDSQRTVRAEAEHVTSAVAGAISADPGVVAALDSDDPTGALQPVAERIMVSSDVDFVTVMTVEGIRVTHAETENIGKPYVGTIPDAPRMLTEEYTGTLGPSVRTITPVFDGDEQRGWVSVGVTISSITETVAARLPIVIAWFLGLVVAGLIGALIARRATRRVTGDLEPVRVQDAVLAYESIRTLGEALRAQTHEHGNRMHTAIALMELGRTDEAIEVLAETSRQSQTLVDHAASGDGDPTVGALLLGKSAQAQERGVVWISDIIPNTPRSTLRAMDAITLLGNVIDNAIDAAAAGPEPRWVNVRLGPGTPSGVRFVVRDSGTGIPDELADRAFDFGVSTKPSDAGGRGVGLALVRSIVDQAGGQIQISGSPTTVLITLPEQAT